MTRRSPKPEPLTARVVLRGLLGLIGSLVVWFLFTGLFTVPLMLAGVRR